MLPVPGRWRSAAANTLLGAWLLSDAARLLVALRFTPDSTSDALLMVAFGYLGLRSLLRKKPTQVSTHPTAIVVTVAGSLAPFLYMFYVDPDFEVSRLSLFIQAFSAAGIAWTAFSIGGNFALLPSHRSIVTRGPYNWVRHPFYAFYLFFDMTFFIDSGIPLVAAAWVVEAILLWYRATLEELLLTSSNAHYTAYCLRVPYRLLPGII